MTESERGREREGKRAREGECLKTLYHATILIYSPRCLFSIMNLFLPVGRQHREAKMDNNDE